MATAWHSNKFLNPARDGAVLPILHLNGYKIANPTVLARISEEELEDLFLGYGYSPYIVDGDEPALVHQRMAAVMEQVVIDVREIQYQARAMGRTERPRWPMIILRTPKGWTCPKELDGVPLEGTWRAHQVPFAELQQKPEHLAALEHWMRSYGPDSLFDSNGVPVEALLSQQPEPARCMGNNPHANGGLLLQELTLPDFRQYALDLDGPGRTEGEATRVLGDYLRDLMRLNLEQANFRLMGPDETVSNRLGAVLDASPRTWMAQRLPGDDHLAPDGRVMEILSEHTCQGWLEGYLLTGRHGLFSCYEAFIHIVDSMFNQHAKWLKVSQQIPWRQPIASLNILLTSHVWRQDHNGFSHQDPGFIDHVVNKKANIVRVYLPPDANSLLCVASECLRSRDRVNVIVAGKQKAPQWLDMDSAQNHCQEGIGIWEWASSDQGGEPDVVMACAGDVPTLETLAAVQILREHAPALRVRVINVVNLMALQPREEHPDGLRDKDFDILFTRDRPIIFAYHGYPWLIHRLSYRRSNHDNLHVRGYKEEGTTTTPFDMTVLNDLDRFHLVMDVIERVPSLGQRAGHLRQLMRDRLAEHHRYIREHGQDLPEVLNWRWQALPTGPDSGPAMPKDRP